MRKLLFPLTLILFLNLKAQNRQIDKRFEEFKVRLLDAYWKRYPDYSIAFGYGKYYDKPAIPNEANIKSNASFFRQWSDSLNTVSFIKLSASNLISYNIIQNQLKLRLWEIETLKIHQWDPSRYNIGRQCNALYTQPYAPLDEKLRTLSKFLQHADCPSPLNGWTKLLNQFSHLNLGLWQSKEELFL